MLVGEVLAQEKKYKIAYISGILTLPGSDGENKDKAAELGMDAFIAEHPTWVQRYSSYYRTVAAEEILI